MGRYPPSKEPGYRKNLDHGSWIRQRTMRRHPISDIRPAKNLDHGFWIRGERKAEGGKRKTDIVSAMLIPTPPNYSGRGLVNLVAELETRLIGSSPTVGLDSDLSALIPRGSSYVLVLFDGLGVGQLGHERAEDLKASLRATIDAPFPSMTTVSLATVATATPPVTHGLTSYKLWMQNHDTVVNTIHMTTAWGEPIPDLDLDDFLPSPNLWERLSERGVEPIVVQPGNFDRTPLTQVLYRGARFEGYWSPEEAVDVTVDIAKIPGRLIFLYVPYVDYAAHVSGQDSHEYVEALTAANDIWVRLSSQLGADIVLVGTADHGHVDIPEEDRPRIDPSALTDGFISEDGRVLFVHGEHADEEGRDVAEQRGGVWVPVDDDSPWWGSGPRHPRFAERIPAGIVFLPPGTALFTDHGNRKLIGNHGGLEPLEVEIPILVGR